MQRLYSLNGKTSYHQISWTLEAPRLDYEEIGSNDPIAPKFDRHLGSTAADVPVKFQSDWKNLNLVASRFDEEILQSWITHLTRWRKHVSDRKQKLFIQVHGLKYYLKKCFDINFSGISATVSSQRPDLLGAQKNMFYPWQRMTNLYAYTNATHHIHGFPNNNNKSWI